VERRIPSRGSVSWRLAPARLRAEPFTFRAARPRWRRMMEAGENRDASSLRAPRLSGRALTGILPRSLRVVARAASTESAREHVVRDVPAACAHRRGRHVALPPSLAAMAAWPRIGTFCASRRPRARGPLVQGRSSRRRPTSRAFSRRPRRLPGARLVQRRSRRPAVPWPAEALCQGHRAVTALGRTSLPESDRCLAPRRPASTPGDPRLPRRPGADRRRAWRALARRASARCRRPR